MKKRVSDLPASEFEVLERTSRMGKSEVRVLCNGCKAEKWIYIWSWAGHSSTRCGSGEHRLVCR